MKLHIRTKRVARRAGGLSLGLAFRFACSVSDYDETRSTLLTVRERHWTRRTLIVGLLLWQVLVDIDTNFRNE